MTRAYCHHRTNSPSAIKDLIPYKLGDSPMVPDGHNFSVQRVKLNDCTINIQEIEMLDE